MGASEVRYGRLAEIKRAVRAEVGRACRVFGASITARTGRTAAVTGSCTAQKSDSAITMRPIGLRRGRLAQDSLGPIIGGRRVAVIRGQVTGGEISEVMGGSSPFSPIGLNVLAVSRPSH